MTCFPASPPTNAPTTAHQKVKSGFGLFARTADPAAKAGIRPARNHLTWLIELLYFVKTGFRLAIRTTIHKSNNSFVGGLVSVHLAET